MQVLRTTIAAGVALTAVAAGAALGPMALAQQASPTASSAPPPPAPIPAQAASPRDALGAPVGSVSFGLGIDARREAVAEVSVATRRLMGQDINLNFDARITQSEQDLALTLSAPTLFGTDPSYGVELGFGALDGGGVLPFDATRLKAEVFATWSDPSFGAFELFGGVRGVDVSGTAGTTSALVLGDAGRRASGVAGMRWGQDFAAQDSAAAARMTVLAELEQTSDSRTVLRSELRLGAQSAQMGPAQLRFSGSAGAVGASNGGTRIDERFYLGPEQLRGFAFAGTGPRHLAASGEAMGGNAYAAARFDLAFPGQLGSSGLTPSLFADLGSVWQLDNTGGGAVDDSAKLRGAAGLSIGWEFEAGRLGLNLSHPFLQETGDRTENVQLTFQTTF